MNTTYQMYSDIEVSSEVIAATPHRQIQLLINKCMSQIQQSKQFIFNKNIQKKHKSISNALDIINYLRGCLNFSDPSVKPLSDSLDSLYAFLEMSLLKASLNNDVTYLDQAEVVLNNVKEGWDGIA